MANKVGGRIVRIKVKGFMTYDELEILPDKGLNLIIGLNGSGKSSIMAAICLGLGGKPQFTGRAVQVSEFIKYSHSKAKVEIELESPHGRNDVITRIIQTDKQLWYLNNKLVNYNEITSIIRKYNIDMSNLCQFLPQEKVAEFSRMDKKQRLVNMIQAIGDPSLVTLFNELKALRNNFCAVGKDLEELENNKVSEQKMNERLKPEIERQEERVKLENELRVLRFEKKVFEYSIIRNELEEVQNEKKQLVEELSAKERDSDELKDKTTNIFSEFRRYETKIQELKKEIFKSVQKLTLKDKSLQACHEEVDNAKIYFENKMIEKEEQVAKLTSLSRQIEGIKDILLSKKDEMGLYKEKLNLIATAYENVKQELSTCDSEIVRVNLNKNALEYKKKHKLEEIHKISNEEDKKYEFLRDKYPDIYTALRWLQQNESSFRAHISPPILVSIKVLNEDYRKFIENSVADRDLLMFVCEDEGDFQRFQHIMKQEKKLSINITMVPKENLADFPSRPITNEMRNLGIQCYVKDLFTAPDSVMRYLCKLNRVHQVPMCTEKATDNIDSVLMYSTVFFTTNERISGKRSRYGQKSMSVKRDIIASRNVLPNLVDNSEALLSVKKEFQEIQNMLNEYKPQCDALEAKRTQLERQQEQLRTEKNNTNNEMRKLNDLKMKYQQLVDSYKRKEKEVIDEEEEKKKVTLTIRNLNSKKLEILAEMHKVVKEILHFKKEKAVSILYMSSFSEIISSLEEKISNLEKEMDEIESRISEVDVQKNRVKSEGLKVWNEIQDIKRSSSDKSEFSGVRSQPCNLEEVEQRISNVEAQLELTNEDIAPILDEFKKREKTILSIEQQIDSFKAQIENLRIKIQEKKERWLPPIITQIESVNQKFSKYYKILKCAGEISLDQTDDTDDFPNYGLQIKLKYRVDEEFMELSQTHHSGGECSVAAIIFILSLQELTDVPFRCIDEINQGMDSINERKIYQLIADAARSGSCSQYFLLTPKLLMDLSYHQDVAVHTIFNSPFLKGKLNVREHLKIAKSNRQ